jgi:hypothetical protein
MHLAEIAALAVALDLALTRIMELTAGDSRHDLEDLRDEAIRILKNADVPPHRDLDYVVIMTPAIDLLHQVFEASLGILPPAPPIES